MKNLIMVLVGLCFGASAFANCQDVAVAKARQYNANPTQIIAETITGGGESGNIVGYRYWMSVDRCARGYVVVDTTDYCHVQQIYTRDGCSVPGLRQW
jgi:hypothetical protein